jgi:hypothetical protein
MSLMLQEALLRSYSIHTGMSRHVDRNAGGINTCHYQLYKIISTNYTKTVEEIRIEVEPVMATCNSTPARADL